MADDLPDLSKCPFCGKESLAQDEQPEPSLHAFTLLYKCGAEIILILDRSVSDFITVERCDDN